MSHTLTKAFRTAQTRVAVRLRDREAGQGALEYIGILVIVAILVVAVAGFFSGVQGDVSTAVTGAVRDILGGGAG